MRRSLTTALLASLTFALTANAQSSATPVCKGHPLTPEAQFASAPPKCDNIAPACERIPNGTDDLIFIGTVTQLTEAPTQMLLDGKCTETTVQTVTLLVKETFSGPLHLESSSPVNPSADQEAEILPKGCAEINFYIESATDYNRIISSILKTREKK